MTPEPMLLEPEIEELLREVAADPDSSLLRVPRSKAVPTLYEDRPAVGPATDGLSAAEKEILRVHRLEVAWLLRQVCLLKLVEGNRNRPYVGRYLNPRTRASLIRPRTIDAGCEELATTLTGDEHCIMAQALLKRAVANPASEQPTILDLAAVAHRLQPSSMARVLASQDLLLGGSPRTALALLNAVLPFHPFTSIGVSAWHTIGLAHLRLGHLGLAHEAYQTASNADKERPSVWMDRMALALQVGDTSDTVRAAQHLGELVTVDHEEVEWFVDSRIQRRRTGDWQPTPEASRLVLGLQNQVGSVGRRIAHVFM